MLDLLSQKCNKGKIKIGVFGLGKSNLGVLDYLKRLNADFDLTLRSDAEISTDIPAKRIYDKASALKDIDEDILFLSPSVRRDRRELALAKEQGTLLFSDAELFFTLTRQKIFAVTGSDGKSTTTYLISEILRQSGKDAAPAGNFGVSLLSVLGKYSTVVAELSSFQLMYMKPYSSCAVITNLTPNHLNWHKSFTEYAEAKSNIIRNAERVVFDYDSELLRPLLSGVRPFAVTSLDFSYEELSKTVTAENYLTQKCDTVYLNGKPYFSTKLAKRKEPYNIRNYMLSAASTLGESSPEVIEKVICSFGGLPHRAELVLRRGNISYINSSIDSSPERTLKTLSALSGRVAVIICGIGKGLSVSELSHRLPELTVGAVFMGDVGNEVSEYLDKNKILYNYRLASNMINAVKEAEHLLSGCGTVILSPAATSFDNYKNFEERGNDFKRAVAELNKNKGT